jgi:hypothetical protein
LASIQRFQLTSKTVRPGAHVLRDLRGDLFLLDHEVEDALAEDGLEPGEVGVIEGVEGAIATRPRTLADGKIIVRPRPFHRGDPDGDGRLSVADAVALLLFLVLAGPSPGCLEAGDADDNGRMDTTDPVVILRWLFLGGTGPAPPGPPPAPCGRDPDGPRPGLGCDAYGGC